MKEEVPEMRTLHALTLCLSMLFFVTPLSAQTPPTKKAPAKTAPTKTTPTKTSKTTPTKPPTAAGTKAAKPTTAGAADAPKGFKTRSGAIDLGELTVQGKLIKPSVQYILSRQAISYQDLKLKRSFVRRIIRSVRTNPF
jgi:hypothetical protein